MNDGKLHIRLEARNPEKAICAHTELKQTRTYSVDGTSRSTLDGSGDGGRSVSYSAPTDEAAAPIVRHCLHRRATAPKRIGVPYQIRELCDPRDWAGVQI